jgi:nucleoid DNA-binding protein
MPYFLKGDIAQSVDVLIDKMIEALEQGNRVEIRGFGSLSIRERKGKSVPNPKTGKIMNIPARKSLHFTMSKSLKEPLIKTDY